VTDRRRLTRAPGGADALVPFALACARAGVDLLQVRERDLDAIALLRLVTDILDVVRPYALRVVVNDRVDVALATGGAGVHLRGDSMPTAAVRKLLRGRVLGRSVHSVAELAAAGRGLDYLICGTVFPTASKPSAIPIGLDGLRDMVARTRVPVLGIGGIGVESAVRVAATGAGVAAIGLFADAWNVSDDHLSACVAQVRSA
jgi:thiamine-phosphate diphosphorylase